MTEGSSSQATAMQVESAKSYVVKPKIMHLREDELVVQVESLVDF